MVLDEPTNDLDIETLDLLQELLDDYDGTILLVSHDRDFLDRVATTTVAMEGQGKTTVYAGGWSDYQSQKKLATCTRKQTKEKIKGAIQLNKKQEKFGLSFTEKHRLETLPHVIERLEREIAKLETYLAVPNLYAKEPLKFQKATEALVERQTALNAAEEEWLLLEEKADG